MTRMLVVSNFYPPHHYGGYELSCRDVVTRWRRRGHHVTVLAASARLAGVDDPEDEDRSLVRRDLGVCFEDGRFAPPPLHLRRRAERANQAALAAALEEVRPDVVSVWHMAGMSCGLLLSLCRLRAATVCVVCDEWPGYVVKTDSWMKLWYRWPRLWGGVERLSGVPTGVPRLAESASFCFVSHDLRDRCLKSSPWLFPRSTVTYSGIDLSEFPLQRDRTWRPWSWKLVTAGRLDPRKGFATAIEALRYLPREATLAVASPVDGSYRSELESIANRCGVSSQVEFSVADRERLRCMYLAADAVVFPSEWAEPFGLVPLEAMACGTPVVATGSGGSGEFLADGVNCLRYPPGDAPQLASALACLAASPELRSRLAGAGFSTAGELTVDRLADQLEDWHLSASEGFVRGTPPPRDMRPYRDGAGLATPGWNRPPALDCL